MHISVRRSTNTYTKTGTSMTMNTGIRNNNSTRLGTTRVRIQTRAYSIEYASDSRFKIQGAGQTSPGHLES